MSEATREFFVGHPWCSNVPRDEAVRAAEDAAAASQTPLPDHRELPESFDHLRSILHGHLGDFGELLKVFRRMNKKLESLEEHCKIEAAKVARLWRMHEGVLPGDHLHLAPSPSARPGETGVLSEAEPWKTYHPLPVSLDSVAQSSPAAIGLLTEEERAVLEEMRESLRSAVLFMSGKTGIWKNTDRAFVVIDALLKRLPPGPEAEGP